MGSEKRHLHFLVTLYYFGGHPWQCWGLFLAQCLDVTSGGCLGTSDVEHGVEPPCAEPSLMLMSLSLACPAFWPL